MDNAPLRVVLVDFDWEDADLLPEILRKPELDVRLVAGEKAQEAGVRVAELCEVPRSIDLADLTREIFDLALVGERSPRRAQIERLLNALGTPVESPNTFLEGSTADTNGHAQSDNGHSNGTHAQDIDQAMADAIPDVGPTASAPEWTGADHGAAPEASIAHPDPSMDVAPATAVAHPQLGVVPAANEHEAVADMLLRWIEASSAAGAELHFQHPDHAVKPAAAGRADPMLASLARLACDAHEPQAVSMMAGPQREKVWAAWPIQIGESTGAIAAGGLDEQARELWEEAARFVSAQWSDAAPAPTGSAPPSHGWLEPDDYLHHLEAVVDRNRDVGERFDLHRLRFNGPRTCLDLFCRALPDQLRAGDVICRPAADQVILLCAGPVGSFAYVRRRLVASWEDAWQQAGPPSPPPPIVDDRVEMVDPQDAEGFLAIARTWLNSH